MVGQMTGGGLFRQLTETSHGFVHFMKATFKKGINLLNGVSEVSFIIAVIVMM